MLDTIRMIHDIILPVDASYVLDEGFDLWLGEDMDYYIDAYLDRILDEIEEDIKSVWSTNRSEQESQQESA